MPASNPSEGKTSSKALKDQAASGDQVKVAAMAYPFWFHSIELAPGITTKGVKSSADLERQLRSLRLPDLRGKTVLDIGPHDGFFSFAAERLGAARVIALDYYIWCTDIRGYIGYIEDCKRTGVPLLPPHETRYWRPNELPGREPFDVARAALGSKVEPVVGDLMTIDLARLGQFDVVLFLGVLYHLEDPLGACRRVAKLTAPGGLAVIETEAVEIPGMEDRPFCEFFPGGELNNDPTNWWAPNASALAGLCRAAGLRDVTILTDKPWRPPRSRLFASFKHLLSESHIPKKLGFRIHSSLPVTRYRAIAHALR